MEIVLALLSSNHSGALNLALRGNCAETAKAIEQAIAQLIHLHQRTILSGGCYAENNAFAAQLRLAITCGHAEVVKALLATGADPEALAYGKDGKLIKAETTLVLAEATGHEPTIRALVIPLLKKYIDTKIKKGVYDDVVPLSNLKARWFAEYRPSTKYKIAYPLLCVLNKQEGALKEFNDMLNDKTFGEGFFKKTLDDGELGELYRVAQAVFPECFGQVMVAAVGDDARAVAAP